MLTLINGTLFTKKTTKRESSKNGETYDCVAFYPSPDILFDASKHKTPRPVSTLHKFEQDGNLSISVKIDKETKKRSVQMRETGKAKVDAKAFLIAIPVRGIILPLEYDENVRFYTSNIIKSDSVGSVEFDGSKYTTVFYSLCTIASERMKDKGIDSTDIVIKTCETKRKDVDGKIEQYYVITEQIIRLFVDGSYIITKETNNVENEVAFPEKGKALVELFVPKPKERKFISAAGEE